MSDFIILSAVARFSLSIDGLLKAVAAMIAGGRLEAAVIMVIWTRIRRIETRVLRLIAAIRAGTLRGGWVLGPRAARAGGAARVVPVSVRLPRRFAWLCGLVPYEAACFAEQLRRVLAEPEMVELLAATPRMGQALRPLCRMLGIEPKLVSPVPVVVDAGDRDGAVVRVAAMTVGFVPERSASVVVQGGPEPEDGFFAPA